MAGDVYRRSPGVLQKRHRLDAATRAREGREPSRTFEDEMRRADEQRGARSATTAATAPSGEVAGVDLGLNSFHMVVARVVEGQIHVIDRIREGVRLAAGLNAKRELDAAAKKRALQCLRRFGQRVRGLPPERVRAVGTNTFRQARNARSFVAQAARALGHPIDVITGAEEARLIYSGVAHGLPSVAGRRLVIDVGGGSTECIVGEYLEPIEANSLYMGCVSHSRQHFPGGRIRASDFARATIAARLELQTIERRFRTLGWDECWGSSGTVLQVATLLRENGWSREGI